MLQPSLLVVPAPLVALQGEKVVVPKLCKNFAITRKNGFGISFVLYALVDVEYSPKYFSSASVGGISKCFSLVLDRPNFFQILAFVTVSMLSFLAMSWASGCGGASATQMYPLKPFVRSHRRNAQEMEINTVIG